MAATFLNGIVIVIVPLLALTADQISKIEEANQDRGSIKAVHLDELSSATIDNEVVPRMHAIGYDSKSTLFLFTSPQKLVTTPSILDALFICHARQTLRLVTIDEAHLYAQHGSTFRDELRTLTNLFFEVVFKVGAAFHPIFLAMTATMSKTLLVKLSQLTNVPWTEPKHQLWAGADAFQQRYIKVGFQVRDHMSREAFPSLIEHFKAKPESSAFVFVNFRSEVKKCEEKLESMLIAAKLDIDIITIHGRMEKHDKFAFIKLFTGALYLPDFKPNICISTAAANTGIDKAAMEMVIRMGIPRDVVTSFQERGRNAREEGMTGVYSITTDWVMYIKLVMTIILPPPSEEATPEYKEINSAITSPNRSSKRQRLSNVALTSLDHHINRATAYTDHVDCVNLYCLPALGCVHARSEWIMHCGEMHQPPPSIAPCETQCHVCDGTHLQTFLPIIFSGALAFMKSSAFGAVLGVEIKADNCAASVASSSSDANMCKSVFGVRAPKTYQVTAFFLQLVALRLIEFKVRNNTEMICHCVQHPSPDYQYKYDDLLFWKGFSFRTAKRGRETIPFLMVLERHNAVRALMEEY